MMTGIAAEEVRVVCTETRFVGMDHYVAGLEYRMKAGRAGQYSAYFRGVSDSDTKKATAAWDERAPDIKGRSSMEPNKQRDYELTWTPVGAALPLTTNCARTFCAEATPLSAMATAASNPQRAMR